MPTLRQIFASPSLVGLHGLRVTARLLDSSAPSAVASCLLYLGAQSNEGQVADTLGRPNAVGYRPEQLMAYISGRGIRCAGFTGTPMTAVVEQVKQGLPAMLLWPDRPGHWVIPCGYDYASGHLVLADPEVATGRFRHMPLADASAVWEAPESRRLGLFLSRPSPAAQSCKHPLHRKQFRVLAWDRRASTNLLRETMAQAMAP